MGEVNKSVYPCLKALCSLREDGVENLAKILGFSRGTMLSRLHGVSEFSLREANVLSRYFDVPIEILFTRDSELIKNVIAESIKKRGAFRGYTI